MASSTRKTPQDAKTITPRIVPTTNRPRKRTRPPRVRLTHFEIRRGEALRLRIAVADEALAEVGDELSALIKRIAPSTQAAIMEPVVISERDFTEQDFIVSRTHPEHDAAYHARLREHLADLFSSLCDTGLETALDVARNERDRRADGGN